MISAVDADDIYKIPMLLHEEGLDDIVVDKLRLDVPPADLSEWQQVVAAKTNPDTTVTIAMVGKYVNLRDSYISLTEALTHAGVRTRTRVKIQFVEATDVEKHGTGCLDGVDAILVPGGFGERGIDGKIQAIRYARENQIPYLGICLGMQLGDHRVRAQRRRPAGREFDRVQSRVAASGDRTDHRVAGREGHGRTAHREVRYGRHDASRRAGSAAVARLARAPDLRLGRDQERHRHRYEFNNRYLQKLMNAGLRFSGFSRDGLVEMIELPTHPFFVASQFHPEFRSTPRDGHPLFTGFVKAARAYRQRADCRWPRAPEALQ